MKQLKLIDNEVYEIRNSHNITVGRIAIDGQGCIFIQERHTPKYTTSIGWHSILIFLADIFKVVSEYDSNDGCSIAPVNLVTLE
jgi:hypothetical protein